jgi:hypothetical protein
VFVPAVRKTWKQCIKSLKPALNDFYSSKQFNVFKKFSAILSLVLLYMIAVCTIFILTPFLIPKFIKDEKKNKQHEVKPAEDDKNYFWRLGGEGTIYCKDCGYKEDIISFIHGFDENGMSDGCSGYQCQSCGKFNALDDEFEGNGKIVTKHTCSCGGELREDKALFCPQCESYNMGYQMEYIT